MPDSVTSIKDAAFQSCTNLEEINFSKKLSTIGPFAFSTNKALKSVDLSNTKVKSIRRKCFIACENMESIQLPDTLKSIEDDAFTRTSIKEFHFPASVERIAKAAFGSFNTEITDAYFEGTNVITGFNSSALIQNGRKGKIHCIKGSALWDMFEAQRKIIEEWNKNLEKYPNLTPREYPELVEL